MGRWVRDGVKIFRRPEAAVWFTRRRREGTKKQVADRTFLVSRVFRSGIQAVLPATSTLLHFRGLSNERMAPDENSSRVRRNVGHLDCSRIQNIGGPHTHSGIRAASQSAKKDSEGLGESLTFSVAFRDSCRR